MKAPQIDTIITQRQRHTQVTDKKSVNALMKIWKKLQNIEIQGDDQLRAMWIYAERGTINDFGKYEDYMDEEIVENQQEFEEMWLAEYPDKRKWYRFSANKYRDEIFFYFDSQLIFQINGNYSNAYQLPIDEGFAKWLESKIDFAVAEMQTDAEAYNKFISRNLPYKKRFGKLLRSDFWSVFPDWQKDFEQFNNPETIEKLEIIVEKSKNTDDCETIKTMTAGRFYRYCEICYNANTYFKDTEKKASPKEKYLTMADGRDCGLRHIDENSEEAFKKWYSGERHCGGHPWEICRGGNSTHIDFGVYRNDTGWILFLAGSSRARVVETVKMALALYDANVPFLLRNANQILKMVQGNDYIGIVPEHIIPRYCHSYFPEEDEIAHFMNLGSEKHNEIVALIEWYPIKKINIL